MATSEHDIISRLRVIKDGKRVRTAFVSLKTQSLSDKLSEAKRKHATEDPEATISNE